MRLYLKTKLIIVMSIIIFMTGLITTIIGTYLINQRVLNQVQDKVRTDLNSAREILNNRIEDIERTIYLAAMRKSIKKVATFGLNSLTSFLFVIFYVSIWPLLKYKK